MLVVTQRIVISKEFAIQRQNVQIEVEMLKELVQQVSGSAVFVSTYLL